MAASAPLLVVVAGPIRYERIVDGRHMFDNSGPSSPRLIAARLAGEERRILDVEAWSALVEHSR